MAYAHRLPREAALQNVIEDAPRKEPTSEEGVMLKRMMRGDKNLLEALHLSGPPRLLAISDSHAPPRELGVAMMPHSRFTDPHHLVGVQIHASDGKLVDVRSESGFQYTHEVLDPALWRNHYAEVGLTGEEWYIYYNRWLARVWRFHHSNVPVDLDYLPFGDARMYQLGHLLGHISEDEEDSEMAAPEYALDPSADLPYDEVEDNDPETEEDLTFAALKANYNLVHAVHFSDAWDSGTHNLDLYNRDILANIKAGWYDPPYGGDWPWPEPSDEVLREAAAQREPGGLATQTPAWLTWESLSSRAGRQGKVKVGFI